jgi:hypothetical protein
METTVVLWLGAAAAWRQPPLAKAAAQQSAVLAPLLLA